MSKKLYGSVNNQATTVNKFYGSVNSEAVEATKLYGPVSEPILNGVVRSGSVNVVSFDAEALRAKVKTTHPELWTDLEDVKYIGVKISYISGSYYVSLSWGHTQGAEFLESFITPATAAEYGIGLTSGTYDTEVNDYIDLSLGYTSTAKLVHQSFGHVEYAPTDYGRVVYYTGINLGYGAGPSSYNVDVMEIDQQGAADFIQDKDAKVVDHAVTMWFDSSYYQWRFETNNSGWVGIDEWELSEEYGIHIYPMDYSNARFDLADNVPVGADLTSPTATVDLLSEEEYAGLSNSSLSPTKNVTVGGQSIIINQIKEFEAGNIPTSIPNFFLAHSSADTVSFGTKEIQTISTAFLAYTRVTNVELPKKVKVIAQQFLIGCDLFDSDVVIPETVTTIGSNFLGNCSSFSHSVTILSPSYTIGSYFLSYCPMFDSALDLSGATSIGLGLLINAETFNSAITFSNTVNFDTSNFLDNAYLFNQPLTFPDSVTSIGFSCMVRCTSFNQPLDLSNITSISSYFLSECTSYNQPIDFNGATIGSYALSECSSFNSAVTGLGVSVGAYFLNHCALFNQPIDFSVVTTSLGAPNFLGWESFNYPLTFNVELPVSSMMFSNCYAMVSPITLNVCPSNSSASIDSFTTRDASAPCYATGFRFSGPFAAMYKKKLPNINTSPYRKIICDDTQEQYGAIYHYPGAYTWMGSGWQQNVEWSIANQTTFDNWVASNGGSQNAEFSFWYNNNTWNVWVAVTGQQYQIADMLQTTGIAVTSTQGGFQNNDGWGMRSYYNIDTTATPIRKVLASGEAVSLASGNSSIIWHLSSGDVMAGSLLSAVINDTSLTTTPTDYMGVCTNLVAAILPSSITTVGSGLFRSCTSYKYEVDLPNATTIGGNFMASCSNFTWYTGVKIPLATSVGGNFMGGSGVYYCPSLPKVQTVGNNFMANCTRLTTVPSLPKVVTIGDYFLKGCTSMNSNTLSLPSSLTTIGTYFLNGCTAYNRNITIPSSVTSIGTYFMYNCNAYTATITLNCAATVASTSNYSFATTSNTAACYTTGIKIGGSYKANWRSRFPDRTSSPYRKTIAA